MRPPAGSREAHEHPGEGARNGRLSFRPSPPTDPRSRTGILSIAPGGVDLGLAYVPEPLDADPLRLVVLLHGAGGSAGQGLDLLLPVADRHRLLLAAPRAHGSTWDVILDGYGPDVATLDRLLAAVAAAYPVGGLAIGGFSDGASYALSLGLGNGDLFDSVVAFSPGFAAPLIQHGRPRLFLSHGRADRVLPIDRCSRRLAPWLERNGYAVTYEEFDGGHEVPPAIIDAAAAWLTRAPR